MGSWIGKLILTLTLTLAALFLYGRFGPGIPVQSVITQKQDLFSVSGEGKVTVVPDTGMVDLGILVSSSSVKTAQDQANTAIKNITAAIKNLGIADRDIKTSNYSVFPQYDYSQGGTGRITGYQVSTNLTITVRNLDNINQIVDQATANGANTVGGIQLTVDEDRRKELLQQAREEAVDAAREKAEGLARAAGITLGKIVNVVESGAPAAPGPFIYAADVALREASGGTPTDIQPGSTDITTSVTLYYETR